MKIHCQQLTSRKKYNKTAAAHLLINNTANAHCDYWKILLLSMAEESGISKCKKK